MDLTDSSSISETLSDVRPDWIVHLAGLVPNARPNIEEADFLNVNVTGTYNLLNAVRNICPEVRVIVASSSAVYGRSNNQDQPITESASLQPQSMYAASKAAQDMLASSFHHQYGLDIVRGRTFNQNGPGEGTNLVCGSLAWQIARIEADLQEPVLKAVTLAPARDFSDVRDVVAGYWAAAENGKSGEAYNICSGRSVQVRQIAQTLADLSVKNDIKITESGPGPGPTAILNQVGSFQRLQSCSGWEAGITLESSMRDLLDTCRAKVLVSAG
jgi:GDP-4-dehydro-6-deoxy-D-mannose reductase